MFAFARLLAIAGTLATIATGASAQDAAPAAVAPIDQIAIDAGPVRPGAEAEDYQPVRRAITTEVPLPDDARPLKHSRGVLPVTFDFAQLAATREGDSLTLNFAPGTPGELKVRRIERRDDRRFSIFGTIAGASLSHFILVVEDDVVAGDIRFNTANIHYKLRYVSNGVHLICDIDDTKYGNCGGATPLPADAPGRGFDPVPDADDEVLPPVPQAGGYDPRGSCGNIGPIWDVMVVYTNVARAAIGGTTAMQAEIQLGVDTSNLTFENSNVNGRYRLVYRAEITYNESGTMGQHRDRLRDPGDGFFDSVVTIRDTVNADMCSIWVDDTDGDTCGIAYCDTAADAAFVCVNWDCAVSNFTYPHEHGHGQGCAHNPEDAGSCPLYSYSYGHRWTSGGQSYRTVMAYNTDNGPYERIGYWSNPGVTFGGVATGTATRDNARTLDDTAGTIEGFQLTRFDVWVDEDPATPIVQIGSYALPYDTITEGVAAIDIPEAGASSIPVLHVVTGTYTTYSGTIDKEMQIIPCGGTVTIGPP